MSDNDKVPICVECAHAIYRGDWVCRRPLDNVFSPVHGWCQNRIYEHCDKQRAAGSDDNCGPFGRFFEDKDRPEPVSPVCKPVIVRRRVDVVLDAVARYIPHAIWLAIMLGLTWFMLR